MAEYQGLRDRATQAVAEGRFEEAERIYTCAFARAEQRAVDYGYTLTILHDFVSFYDRYVTHLLKEQRFVFQQRPRDRDNMRRHGQARKRLYRAQLACYQRILNLQEQVLGPDHLQVSDTLLAMAHLHRDHFNEFDAFPFELRALAIRERALGTVHPLALTIVRRLAREYSTLTSFAAAAPLWHRLLEYIGRQTATGVAVDVEGQREVLRELGKSYNALKDYVAAEQIWRRYLELPGPTPFKFEPDSPYSYLNTLDLSWVPQLDGLYGAGRACAAQGKWVEAARLLHEAVAVHRQHPEHFVNEDGGARHLSFDAGLHDYANVLRQSGHLDEALPLFEEALAMNRQSGLHLARLLHDYALVLRDLYREDEAIGLERQASAISGTQGRSWRERHGI